MIWNYWARQQRKEDKREVRYLPWSTRCHEIRQETGKIQQRKTPPRSISISAIR